jgi:diguanylate cyclase (GGDEF)-like protein/PAS domain S-box-containing protein
MKPILPSLRSLRSPRNDESVDNYIEGQKISVTYSEVVPPHITVELTLDALVSSAFQHSELPMALVAPHGEWLVANPALCSLLGYPSRQLCDLTMAEIAHEEDAPLIEAELEKIRDGLHSASLDVRFYNRSGELVKVKLFAGSARQHDESTKFLLVQLHPLHIDGTDAKNTDEKVNTDNEVTLLETRISYLEHELIKVERQNEILSQQLAEQFDATAAGLNVVDPLTGAYARGHLERMLDSEISRCNRSNSHFALIVADIDYYARIKAGSGEENAEKVLITAAQIFEVRLRRADVLFRIGEDEFAMLLPNTSVLGASVVANSLRKRLGDFLIEDVGLCSASFGVIEWSGHENGTFMLERAIETLKRAKQEGRNRVVIGEEE